MAPSSRPGLKLCQAFMLLIKDVDRTYQNVSAGLQASSQSRREPARVTAPLMVPKVVPIPAEGPEVDVCGAWLTAEPVSLMGS